MLPERHFAEDVGGEALLSVLLFQSLLPEGRRELEDAAPGPRREQAPRRYYDPSDSRCTALDFAFGLYESPRPDTGRADGPLLFRIAP